MVEVFAVPLEGRLSELSSIQIRQVRRTGDEALVDSLIAQHHYLGYARPVGEHLKYLVTADGWPIGFLHGAALDWLALEKEPFLS